MANVPETDPFVGKRSTVFKPGQIQGVQPVPQVAPGLSLAQVMHVYRITEKNKSWYISLADIALIISRKPDQELFSQLMAYVDAGLLEYIGEKIFVFRIKANIPFNANQAIVPALRPMEFNYVSFETALNAYGVISQIPTMLTVATTGASGLYQSWFCNLEFVHVDHDPQTISSRTRYDAVFAIHEALPDLAFRDLLNVGRNLHLVDQVELEEVLHDYPYRQE